MLDKQQIRKEVERAIRNSKPFYATDVQRFAEELLEKNAARKVGRIGIGRIVYLAEVVKQHDDSYNDVSEPPLQLEGLKRYGPDFLRALVEQIHEVDKHGASFGEARKYAEQMGVCLQ